MKEERVSLEVAREHGMTAEEYRRLEEALGRRPTIEELGVTAVMWSEHCSYKSSRVHLRRLPSEGPRVLQGPGENAGALAVGEGLAVVFKIESHNHPSYIEPVEGAATGVGGILRDVFAMGARPIASLDSLRFGDPSHPRTPYLVRGVVNGIGRYGNSVGVATVGGDLFFDSGYDGNCLVNAFTLGVVEESRLMRARASGVGNAVVLYGSRTGRDGIHGASLLASAEFDSRSEEKRPTVQVGDPFTEKLLLEATLEILSRDLAVAVQDLGAAGLTSSSVEMAARGGLGIEIDLDRVPLREAGMSAYEILLSESQERMLVVTAPERVAEVAEVCERWDLEWAVIGALTDDRLFRVRRGGEELVRVPVSLVADPPALERPLEEPSEEGEDGGGVPLAELTEPGDYEQAVRELVASPNVCSRRWVFEQYDHYVGGSTLVHPGADSAVLRLPGTEIRIALTVDVNPRFCSLDPYVGACIAVCEAARNLAVTGAEPIGVTDCLNFGNPERPQIMWQFAQAVDGIRDACNAFGVPVVSGNVSFYNETEGRAIPPTPTIAMVGLLRTPDPVTPWFKADGDAIVLLGRTREELAGSEYARLFGEVRGNPPWVDLEAELHLQRLLLDAGARSLLRSAHDVSEGGIAAALVECCCSAPEAEPRRGAHVRSGGGMRPDAWLFGESQARAVVSVRREHASRLRDLAAAHEVPAAVIGEVGGSRLEFDDLVSLPVDELSELRDGALEAVVERGGAGRT